MHAFQMAQKQIGLKTEVCSGEMWQNRYDEGNNNCSRTKLGLWKAVIFYGVPQTTALQGFVNSNMSPDLKLLVVPTKILHHFKIMYLNIVQTTRCAYVAEKYCCASQKQFNGAVLIKSIKSAVTGARVWLTRGVCLPWAVVWGNRSAYWRPALTNYSLYTAGINHAQINCQNLIAFRENREYTRRDRQPANWSVLMLHRSVNEFYELLCHCVKRDSRQL